MRVFDSNIFNVRWTWKRDKDGKLPNGVREPFVVPDDIIDTSKEEIPAIFDFYVSIEDNPFTLIIKYRSVDSPSNVLRLDGMIYDQYLNMIKATAITESGDNFQGVFGLGERANKDFFYKDGVYSMHARD